MATKKTQVTWAEAEKSPNELTIIENVAGDLQRHRIVPVIVYITKDQHDAIARLKMDFIACIQTWLDEEIKLINALVEAEADQPVEVQS